MKKQWISMCMILMLLGGIFFVTPAEKASAEEEKKLVNVVFLIDSTGSMRDEINNVKKNLSEFVQYLGEQDVTLRMSLIDFQDITYDGLDSTKVHTLNHSVWFEKAEDMKKELASIALGDGGDLPETLLDAMGNIFKPELMTFNSNSIKFAFILSDSYHKDNNTHDLVNIEDATAKLKDLGMYTCAVIDPSYKNYYTGVTSATNGEIWSIYGDFGKIMIEFADKILKTPMPTPPPSVVPVTGISFDKSQESIQMKVGETVTINPSLEPSDATNQELLWYSDQESIVSVTDGVVTALAEGYGKITAKTEDGGYTAVANITVKGEAEKPKPEEGFDTDDGFDDMDENDSLVSNSILELLNDKVDLAVGNSYLLNYDVYPEQKITFSSDHSKIIKVDADGKITALNRGVAIITAKTEDGTTAECIVTALSKPTAIKLNRTQCILKPGGKITLKEAIAPIQINKKYKTVMWSTSNPRVATVKNGVVQAKKPGSCVITVNTLNGYRATCKIVVDK